MQDYTLQELILATHPLWHYWMVKPFKQLLDEDVSVGMYYCIQTLSANGDTMTMSELAKTVHCSKQQMTKTVNKLIECGLTERIQDPTDRRIVRLKLTEEGMQFMHYFLDKVSDYYKPMFDLMSQEEQSAFAESLLTLHRIFMDLKAKSGTASRSAPHSHQ